MFFVSPSQVNFQIPPGTATGPATVRAMTQAGTGFLGSTLISNTAPGLFSANGNGQGPAAAVALRVLANGAQLFEPVVRFDAAQNRFVAVPIDLGPEGDQVFLVLFGTGFRFRSTLGNVSVTLGGTDAQVTLAGAQGDLIGVDQLNVRVPRSLAGRGEVEVALTVDSKSANKVMVIFK
ncbi:MAG TPA: hypothetical protein VKN18_07730 [Blastocatellia bacterium]|nr:hypothetical protein [Blastocatellia bacterium]